MRLLLTIFLAFSIPENDCSTFYLIRHAEKVRTNKSDRDPALNEKGIIRALNWKEYFELFCDAVGNPQDLAITEDAHPMMPDIILYAGRNATVSYEPENGELNYGRNRIKETINNVVSSYLS